MRSLLLIALTLAFPVHAGPFPSRTVYLDGPAALEILEKDNPAHYRKIVEMLRVAHEVSCEKLPRVFAAKFQATSTQCTPMQVLTSHPPKRRLQFDLGDTRYVTNLVIRGPADQAIKVR